MVTETKKTTRENQVQISPELEKIIQTTILPSEWDILDKTVIFSKEKVLFPYQKTALENALKALYVFFEKEKGDKSKFAELYFEKEKGDKSEFAKFYSNPGILSLSLKEKLSGLAYEFFNTRDEIPFNQICNRMSFWMATGSGKTLVIVKLIDILFDLMETKLIPEKPIMFLTAREDLLHAFEKYVKEFNDYHLSKQIIVKPLNEYSNIVMQRSLFRTVFTYRSDLISDEKGDKILDFREFLSQKEGKLTGNWYVILDEAHKGEKGESKRQLLINILAKEGFLFNFSATFTEPIDIVTTVYNMNLAEFIKSGYGKQIYVSQSEIKGFEKDETKREFTIEEKKKIILKTLILLTGLKKAKSALDLKRTQSALPDFYHNPLAIYLVNSVNENDSDLKLLFEELLRFAQGIDVSLLEKAKEELIEELKLAKYTLGEDKGKDNQKNSLENNLIFFEDILKYITINDIYKHVYNSSGAGSIEYIHYPENYKELALKHTSGDKPFALIKLGTTKDIMKSFLSDYAETELYEDQRWFENLNEKDSPFNLLIGSRAFYEGWDSPRPNVIVFINLGQQSDAKKFVLQAIGRGVRIEPIKNERQRLKYLLATRKDISDIAESPFAKALESLFVFATNKTAVETILQEIHRIKNIENWHKIEFKKNDELEGKLLLIPNYKQAGKKVYELDNPPKFVLNQKNYELLKIYFDLIPKERFVLERGCSFSEFYKLKELITQKKKYFKISEKFHYRSFERLLSALFSYLRSDVQELDTEDPFIPLPDKVIVHFKDIMIKEEILNDFKAALQSLYNSEGQGMFLIEDIILEKLLTHYYIPITYTRKTGTKELIKHIITVDSEVDFL